MKDAHVFSHYKEAVIGAVVDLAAEHPEIVFLDADLSSCIGSTTFQTTYPDRFFNCGIAEANMVGVAAGLASTGLVPFIHSFGCFASRRDYDQLFISVGYTHQTVHVIGSDPGITAQYNGGTHMPFEDIALMRQIPGMVIVEPSDAQSLYDLTLQVYANGHSSYIRTPRKGICFRYSPEDKIELGKGIELADGKDVAIIATGALMVDAAVEAEKMLAADGIKATVVDLHTIKPIDREIVIEMAKKHKKLISVEEHSIIGGLGSAISEVLTDEYPAKLIRVGIKDTFGESGTVEELIDKYGLSAKAIYDIIK